MNERQIVHTNNGSLVLRKILQSDAGTYNCTVTALNHKFKNSKKNSGTIYSNPTNTLGRKGKNDKVHYAEHNGFKSASSSMRIKVIGKK